MLPLVSVIVPCYNQAQYLSETLDSLLAQTYGNWECIIVNDGSIDNTEEIANKWIKKDKRFKYIAKQNGGLSSARNSGIKSANGEYILPLDSDDLIHPDYVQKAVEILISEPQIKLVYANAKKFGCINQLWNLKPYLYKTLLEGNMIYCSAIYRKADYFLTEGYDENMLSGLEDWDFWIQLLNEKDSVYKINKVMFYYRVKQTSMITSIAYQQQKELRLYIYKKHQVKYTEYFKDPIDLIRENSLLKTLYKESADYRLGNFLINPMRVLIEKFQKD